MRFFWVLIFVCFLSSFAFAQTNQTESLTFTTYYPSPYGVYRNVRLYPTTEGASSTEPGTMYYDGRAGWQVLRYHNDTQWINVTDSGGGGGGGMGVLTVSCPWGSDGKVWTGGLGFGDQCDPDGDNCCELPACPDGWTEVGTEVNQTALDSPRCPDGVMGCWEWMNGCAEAWQRPVAVGNVMRKCTKQGATVITLSKPWSSDHLDGNNMNKGWGNQCTEATNYLACGGMPPDCPVGWHSIGINVHVYAVSCPKTWANPFLEGCYWGSEWSSMHPVAGGAVVNICEKNITS